MIAWNASINNGCPWQGRPKKGPEPQFSLKALVPSLESYLKTKVAILATSVWPFENSDASNTFALQMAQQCLPMCIPATALVCSDQHSRPWLCRWSLQAIASVRRFRKRSLV